MFKYFKLVECILSAIILTAAVGGLCAQLCVGIMIVRLLLWPHTK